MFVVAGGVMVAVVVVVVVVVVVRACGWSCGGGCSSSWLVLWLLLFWLLLLVLWPCSGGCCCVRACCECCACAGVLWLLQGDVGCITCTVEHREMFEAARFATCFQTQRFLSFRLPTFVSKAEKIGVREGF